MSEIMSEFINAFNAPEPEENGKGMIRISKSADNVLEIFKRKGLGKSKSEVAEKIIMDYFSSIQEAAKRQAKAVSGEKKPS